MNEEGSPMSLGLEPAAVLPGQFQGRAGALEQQPERRLMIAVLEDAMRIYEGHARSCDKKGQRRFQEAARWFASNAVEWPFSFLGICSTLGLEPQGLRARMAAWLVEGSSRGPNQPRMGQFKFRGSAWRYTIGGRALRRASRNVLPIDPEPMVVRGVDPAITSSPPHSIGE
jgi:hypothetical protein